jgi:hypothetical protein
MVMPNFLIIGAAKAGTTSLYSYLNQHPQIYMSPIKEPRFFALEGDNLSFQGPSQGINHTSVTTIDGYLDLFQGVTSEIAIGEASTLYLHSAKALRGIKNYIPRAKIIAILRDPVDRSYSSYLHLVRDGYETLSFQQALLVEDSRIHQKWQPLWYYTQRSFYYNALNQYLKSFDSEQIKIYIYDDFAEDSSAIVKDIFDFLDVDHSFQPDMSKANVSGIPKNELLNQLFARDNLFKSIVKPLLPGFIRQRIAHKVRESNLAAKPNIPFEAEQYLRRLFHDDILNLQDLIQRDLSKWLL